MLLRTPRHLDPTKASADDWPLHTTASRLVVWQMGFFQVCWLTLPLLFIKLRRQLQSPPTLRLKASVASGDAFCLPSARVLPRLESSLGAVCGQFCQCKHYFISTLVLPKENQWDSFLRLLFSESFVCTLINFWRFQLRNVEMPFVRHLLLNKVLDLSVSYFRTRFWEFSHNSFSRPSLLWVRVVWLRTTIMKSGPDLLKEGARYTT